MTPVNADLIGVPGGRARLETPALVIDLDVLERNIARMAEHARARGVALRPHAKTHKSAEIARRQIEAGAVGVCVAKLGEAEALAAAGIEHLLITSPVVTETGIARLAALNTRIAGLMAACDSFDVAKKLDEAARTAGKPLRILVDIDPGMGRTGIVPGDTALSLVSGVAHARDLDYAGVQFYAGNLQHLESPNERRDRSLSALRELGQFRDRLAREGLAPTILSGGGTGTFDIDPDARVLTELQAGSYVFMDRQYKDVWEKPGEPVPFETALAVETTVISVNRRGMATTDAGLKAFATDAGAPEIAAGAPARASYDFFGDEQGRVTFADETQTLRAGDRIACVVPHCDPTVNLYDWYHVVRGETLEAIWRVDARGRSA
jgi:D-serine deaminase-like pyridoxal phosphate-dependent protein